jgi:hypothetical protein
MTTDADATSPPADGSPAPGRSGLRFIVTSAILALVVYLAVAYVLAPLLWVRYAHRHPALLDMPGVTLTGDDHPGDPINLGLIGSEHDLQAALLAAGWFPADPVTLESSLKIAAGTVLRRPYDDAPVSPLYFWGRKQDLAFEQPVGNDPRRRHHVRFWGSRALDDQGRPLWVGAATFDQRVGLSHTTGEITHHIASDVDAERDHLLATLEQAHRLREVQTIPNFHATRSGRNGGGDLWETDGSLKIGVLLAP